jgi:hypothetical protein
MKPTAETGQIQGSEARGEAIKRKIRPENAAALLEIIRREWTPTAALIEPDAGSRRKFAS